METLTKIMEKFENILSKKNPHGINLLQNGLIKADIITVLREVGVENDELLEFYSWKNGVSPHQEEVIEKMKLFSFGIMFSIQDSIKEYQYSLIENLYERHYFPIFTNGGGDCLLLDISEPGGKIYLHSPPILLSDEPMAIYSNLKLLFETVIECYNSNAYKVDESGILEINFDLEEEISRELNPNEEFWS